MCWPTMGWARTARYYKHRMFRGGDSVHRITGGLAIGASVSFTPFLGTHFVQAAFLAVVFRMNWPASLIGTFLGTPWTFPVLFWISYTLGTFLLGIFGYDSYIELPDDINFELLLDQPQDFFGYMIGHPQKLLLPLTIGGYCVALLFWPFAYAVLYYPVKSTNYLYHKERLRRIYARAAKKREERKKRNILKRDKRA